MDVNLVLGRTDGRILSKEDLRVLEGIATDNLIQDGSTSVVMSTNQNVADFRGQLNDHGKLHSPAASFQGVTSQLREAGYTILKSTPRYH